MKVFHSKKTFIFAFVILISFSFEVFASPFSDVNRKHWAYKAIIRLLDKNVMGGYPDGTFKGRRVVTRYDLAMQLARILSVVEEISKKAVKEAEPAKKKKTRRDLEITREDLVLLDKLATEFKNELKALGVKIDGVDSRLEKVENAKKLEIEGKIEVSDVFVIDPLTTSSSDDKPGFSTLDQTLSLEFEGHPSKDIEAYMKFKYWFNGWAVNELKYNNSSKNVNPFLDDYVTDLKNDRGVKVDKTHFELKSGNIKLRFYTNEDRVKLTDPMVLISKSSYHPEKDKKVSPFCGLEFNGTNKKLNYNLTFSKEIEDDEEDDVLGMRLNYVVPEEIFQDTSLTLGASFVEQVYSYTKKNQGNDIFGLDFIFKRSQTGKLNLSLETLRSNYMGKSGSAAKMDATYKIANLDMTLNYYNFSENFRATTADEKSWLIDSGEDSSDGSYNYGNRVYTSNGPNGERCSQLKAKYNFKNEVVAVKSFEAELVYLTKSWAKKDYSGSKISLQMWSDFNDKNSGRLYYEKKDDAKADERGKTFGELELKSKLKEKVTSTIKISNTNDLDNKDDGGTGENNYQTSKVFFEINSNVSKKIWGKGHLEYESFWPGAIKEGNNFKIYLESTYAWNRYTNIKATIENTAHKISNPATNTDDKDSQTTIFSTEFITNYTDKLKSKTVIWHKNFNETSGTDDKDTNIYGEVIFDPEPDTHLKIVYGDWNKRDDDTEEKITFELSTEF